MLPCAIDAPLTLGVIVIDCEGVVRPVVWLTGGGIDLWPLVPVAAQPLAAEGDAVTVFQPSGVKPRCAALHEGAVPVLPAVAGIAENPVLYRDARERFGVREGGTELDDPAQGGGSVQNAAGPFDYLHLLQVLQRQEAPSGTARIPAEDRQSVEQHGHARTGAKAVSAAAADLGLAVDDGDTGGARKGLVRAGWGALIDQFWW